MLLFGIISLLIVSRVDAGGELIIAKSPPSIKFRGDDPVDMHMLSDICSAAMGLTTEKKSDWQGMVITDPFNFAQAIVVLYVDGISSLSKSSNLQKYILSNDEDEFVTWVRIKNRIINRYPVENSTLLRLELDTSDTIGDIKTQYLNKELEEDAEFLKEITELNKHIGKVKKSGGMADLYWYTMKSLHQLVDLKGAHDLSTVEAKEMVYEALLKLAKVFNSEYDGKALVLSIVGDSSHTRLARSATDAKENVSDGNSYKDHIYDPDFPVVFNIILWFSVALVFSLIAISVFIAQMDPGRDSIIYRMTSNRMKKDS